jgi:hypothetical protein
VMPKNFRKFQVLQKSSKLAIRVLFNFGKKLLLLSE